MSFLKKIFDKKKAPIKSYEDFWKWFQSKSNYFFDTVKKRDKVEENFFNKISPKLDELENGIYFLTGMYDENTVELIFTPDGNIKKIVYVEELVESSPSINGWKFTALKPEIGIENLGIKMSGYVFDKDKLFFYSNDQNDYPDEINITIIHKDLNQENKSIIETGTFVFLDNYLGELKFATAIDNLEVISINEAKEELIPIQKLKKFLVWRQKEFIEKYEGIRYNTENDNYSIFEAGSENSNPLIAIINTDLLYWDKKASHPWIVIVEMRYDGKENNGMPDKQTIEILNEIEEKIVLELKDYEGNLNIGRQTTNNIREVFFACKDFRKPSKVLQSIQDKFSSKMEISFNIYKDKYWKTFNGFLKSY